MDCREQEGHNFQLGSLCGVWGAAPALGKQLWGTAGNFELKTKSHQPRNPLHESGKEEHTFITKEALSQDVMVCQTLC